MKSKALLLVVAASQLTCHQVIFTAPPGTTMQCSSNPVNIPAVNGVSVISCLLQEEIGTPVADGTTVQFFTTLGRIPEQGKTNDGVVRVNLEATGRSGLAHVTIFSGGGTTGGGGGGGSSTTSTSLSAESGFRASAGQVSASLSGVMADASLDVNIGGNANAARVEVTASPTRINENRPAEIRANVFDPEGNPVPGVAVFFSLLPGNVPATLTPTTTPTATGTATGTATTVPALPANGGSAETESLDSQGQPVFTDTNGQAHDVLRTRWPRDAGIRQVTVIARTSNGREQRVVVTIN